jgi:DNA-binding PadR family transcriptional regulator
MSLDHAILGFLNYHPSTGYELKKIFDTSARHFWHADQAQIYRTLARLTQQGWVGRKRVRQEDRPDRKVYQITEQGRAELRRWISDPPPFGQGRSALLVQVFFSGQLSDQEILKGFEAYTAQLRELLAGYEAVPAELEPYRQEFGSPRDHFFWRLTLENGIASVLANLAWAEGIIQRIRDGQVPRG